MSPAVIPIRKALPDSSLGAKRAGLWALLELASAGQAPRPVGIILVDGETDATAIRMKEAEELPDLEEDEADVLSFLPDDLAMKSRENGGRAVLDSLEDSLSNFLRITDREEIAFFGRLDDAADRLYETHVDSEVRPFVTHLPMYSLRAAATKFGEQMDVDADPGNLDWVRPRKSLRLSKDMFVAQVVGRSMEPLVPDGSFCVFRAAIAGSRQGKRLLIEQFGELDNASRFTVKRYTSVKTIDEETGEWQHGRIRLEPLNPEFEAFNLGPDQFRVVAEFVEVLSLP